MSQIHPPSSISIKFHLNFLGQFPSSFLIFILFPYPYHPMFLFASFSFHLKLDDNPKIDESHRSKIQDHGFDSHLVTKPLWGKMLIVILYPNDIFQPTITLLFWFFRFMTKGSILIRAPGITISTWTWKIIIRSLNLEIDNLKIIRRLYLSKINFKDCNYWR